MAPASESAEGAWSARGYRRYCAPGRPAVARASPAGRPILLETGSAGTGGRTRSGRAGRSPASPLDDREDQEDPQGSEEIDLAASANRRRFHGAEPFVRLTRAVSLSFPEK